MTGDFRRWLILLMGVAALVCGLRAGLRENPPPGDFLRYDRAGALVWRGEAARIYDDAYREQSPVWNDPDNLPEARFRYSPSLAVFMAPVGALPPRAGFVVWSILTGALTVLGIGLAASLAMRELAPGVARWWPAVAATVPLIHLYSENIKLGQMNCFAFAFSVAALWALDRGKDRAAGLLTAGAVVAKHIPILLVVWFAWKRRWKAAGWSLAALFAFVYVFPTATLGPQTHHELLRQWTAQQDHLITETGEDEAVRTPLMRPMVDGQSAKALVYRYFTPTVFRHLASKAKDPDAPAGAVGIFVNNGRSIGFDAAYRLWGYISFALFTVLLLATAPRPGRDSPEEERARFPLEAGLLLLTMLLVSPESRNPHFQMMAITYAALAAGFLSGRSGGVTGKVLLFITALAVFLVAVSTRGVLGRSTADEFLARGSIGGAAFLLFAVSAWILFARRRATARSEVPEVATETSAP